MYNSAEGIAESPDSGATASSVSDTESSDSAGEGAKASSESAGESAGESSDSAGEGAMATSVSEWEVQESIVRMIEMVIG